MAKFILVILFSIITNQVCAQISFDNDSLLMVKFDYEVKQMEQFFDRFDFKEPVKFADNLKSTRTRNIVSLLNLKDTALYHNAETISFLKFVSTDSNKVYLNSTDHNWYAFAHCSFVYHSKRILLDIILKPEGNPKIGYKWVILDVKNGVFLIAKKEEKTAPFINPMNHEIGFTELSKALNKKNDIFQYTAATYSPDPLSIFLFLVQSGDLKFIQINSIDFQFLQVNGWIFTVNNYNRSEYNSGWLISSLKKMNETEKTNYIKNHFNR